MEELITRIARMVHASRSPRVFFEELTEEQRDGLEREVHYTIFKQNRVVRDPFIVVRDLKGEQIGSRQRSVAGAREVAEAAVLEGAEAVDIVEVFEQRLGGYTAHVQRSAVAE